MKRIIIIPFIIGFVIASAVLLASPAKAEDGCVTYREAVNTLTDDYQPRAEIQRGFGATPEWVDRHGQNLLRASYHPCRYPRQAYMEVIYTRNPNTGQWKSFFWVYYLYSPYAARTVSDQWSGDRG